MKELCEELQSHSFRGKGIPFRMFSGIINYVEHNIPPGDFLLAILKNDLKRACLHADDENIDLIPVYISFFYWNIPSIAWGSKEAVRKWVEEGKT